MESILSTSLFVRMMGWERCESMVCGIRAGEFPFLVFFSFPQALRARLIRGTGGAASQCTWRMKKSVRWGALSEGWCWGCLLEIFLRTLKWRLAWAPEAQLQLIPLSLLALGWGANTPGANTEGRRKAPSSKMWRKQLTAVWYRT